MGKNPVYRPVFATIVFLIVAVAMLFLVACANDSWVKIAAGIVQIVMLSCLSVMAARMKVPKPTSKKGAK